jgi:AraC-like DNA-binding protein
MPRKLHPVPTPVGDTDPFTPDRARPVRVRARSMPMDAHFEPHRHPWAQLAYCASGILQVSALPDGPGDDGMTYIVPPSRAVWIEPRSLHAITVIEAAEFRTLYMHESVTPGGWHGCRMLEVTPLLRELVQALDAPVGEPLPPAREVLLTSLVLDELRQSGSRDMPALGVPLPSALTGDKRLRALCDAVMKEPAKRATLGEWAADVGASERTMARLFRDELGLSYQQWRQQVVLAHALPMLARAMPVSHVAQATGYSSESAFSAMFKSAMGQPPRAFQPRAIA